MAGERSTDSLWSKSLLVLLGAVVGVLPVLTSQHLQARAQREQQLLDRRISLLRDYGSACGRVGAALDSIAVFHAIAQEGGVRLIEFKDVQKVMHDGQTAARDLFVQSTLAKTLLGVDLGVSLSAISRGFAAGLRVGRDAKNLGPNALAALGELIKEGAERSALQCEKDLQALAERVASLAR